MASFAASWMDWKRLNNIALFDQHSASKMGTYRFGDTNLEASFL
jgi:hypothetical protein